MKNNKTKTYFFIKKYVTSENIKVFICCIITFCYLIKSIKKESFDITNLVNVQLLISIFLLFISSWIADRINNFLQNKFEDYAKQTVDYEYLIKKYQLSNLINFYQNDETIVLPYEYLCETKDMIINVVDLQDKFYQLPTQIAKDSDNIFSVHKGSIIYNNINIRLDDIKINNNIIELLTSRTYYFDSLLTNRACDYVLSNGRSIREIYEPGPYLKQLKLSKMSNHIGFNGFVITKDNYVPLIHRGRTVSIAKGIVSTSVSASLKSKYAIDSKSKEFTINGLANSIRKEIKDELNLDLECTDEEIIKSIKCFYRDLLDGGKPQFFVLIYANNTKNEIEHIFYNDKTDNSSDELKMKKDGTKMYMLKLDDILNATIPKYNENRSIRYDYNKIIINGENYNTVPGLAMSIQLLRKDLSF